MLLRSPLETGGVTPGNKYKAYLTTSQKAKLTRIEAAGFALKQKIMQTMGLEVNHQSQTRNGDD